MVRFFKKNGHKVELLPTPGPGEKSQCPECTEYFGASAHRRCKYKKCEHVCCFECVMKSNVGCGECLALPKEAETSAEKVELWVSTCKPLRAVSSRAPSESLPTESELMPPPPAGMNVLKTARPRSPLVTSPVSSEPSVRRRPRKSRAPSPGGSEFSMTLRPRRKSRPASPVNSEFSMCLRPRKPRAASPVYSELSIRRKSRAASPGDSEFSLSRRSRKSRAASPVNSEFSMCLRPRKPRATSPVSSVFSMRSPPRKSRARATSPGNSEFSMSLRSRKRRAVSSDDDSDFSIRIRRKSRGVSPAGSEFSMCLRPRRSRPRPLSPTISEVSSIQEEAVPYPQVVTITPPLLPIQNQENDGPNNPVEKIRGGKPKKTKLSYTVYISTGENSYREILTLPSHDDDDENVPAPKVNGSKMLCCKHCNETFPNRASKSHHLQTFHAQERPHQCKTCNFRFVGRRDLQRHEMTHEKIKPYHCSICRKSFTRAHSVKLHTNKIHASAL